MFGWFGRKGAPEVRPFVPAWLQGEGESGGYARGYQAQLNEVYRSNPVGLRSVRLWPDWSADCRCSRRATLRQAQGRRRLNWQVQKELLHNLAIERIDALLCPVVEGPPAVAPPADPEVGSCYLVAEGATGAWAGQDGALASFGDGGWSFLAPLDGMSVVERTSGEAISRREGAWEMGVIRGQEIRVEGVPVVRGRRSPIDNPSAGSVVDSECRAAVTQILDAMRGHGLIG